MTHPVAVFALGFPLAYVGAGGAEATLLSCKFVQCGVVNQEEWNCSTQALQRKTYEFDPLDTSGYAENGDEFKVTDYQVSSLYCDSQSCSTYRLDRVSGFLVEDAFGDIGVKDKRPGMTLEEVYNRGRNSYTRYTYECEAASPKF